MPTRFQKTVAFFFGIFWVFQQNFLTVATVAAAAAAVVLKHNLWK